MAPVHLLIIGRGYTGQALAQAAVRAGHAVTLASRTPHASCPSGSRVVALADAKGAIAACTHLVSTAPPDPDAADPVLALHGAALAAAPRLRWLCYLSTTGVYGDRGGAWVDETTEPAPATPRAVRRLAAEQAWRALATQGRAVDLFRLAGIYGPGRSAFDDLRAGTARRIVAPDHAFGRIHLDDIVGAVLAAASRLPSPGTTRILHGNDDLPAPSADVIEYAASLLGCPPPPARTLAEAWPAMSEMAQSFWSENRRVASRLTQDRLGRPWLYPSFREGLAAILAAT